jgi:L-alanine-DL-glutamate epimerase-like enolase superfamily enzyme
VKVTNVRATWVHVPIPLERQHVSDFGKIASFDSVIVKIDTDAGHVGWGEAKAGVGSASSAYGLAAIVNQDFAPLLVGQDPRDISRLWDVMYNTPREGYALDRGHVLPQLGRMVEDQDLYWLEEPVTADDKIGLAEVRRASSVPIATGESEFTRHDFREIAELRGADILQPDLAIAGGLTEGVRIASIASAYNLRLAPHLWSGAPAFAAGLALAASQSAGFILEYSLGANPLLHELVHEKFPVIDGQVEIPDRPGLGITVDEDFLRRHARE